MGVWFKQDYGLFKVRLSQILLYKNYFDITRFDCLGSVKYLLLKLIKHRHDKVFLVMFRGGGKFLHSINITSCGE